MWNVVVIEEFLRMGDLVWGADWWGVTIYFTVHCARGIFFFLFRFGLGPSDSWSLQFAVFLWILGRSVTRWMYSTYLSEMCFDGRSGARDLPVTHWGIIGAAPRGFSRPTGRQAATVVAGCLTPAYCGGN